MPPDEFGDGLDRWAQHDRLTRVLAEWTPRWGVLVYHDDGTGRTYPSAVYRPYPEAEARGLVEHPNTYIRPRGDGFQVGRRAIPWLPNKPPPHEYVPMDDSDK
ncbi:hypothetical protein [Nocardia thraciensis]